jgi:rod shape-determining protein MreC
VNFSRQVNGFFYEELGELREYLYLKEENKKLHLENNRLLNLLEQNKKLYYVTPIDSVFSDTVMMRDRWEFYFIPADVINNSVNKQFNYLTIDKGSKQGVEADMAVISSGAVVGVIAGVSENFSTVIPLLNRNFKLGSKIARNDYFGILEWTGMSPNTARLREIPLHVDVRRGDSIVTSGFSAIFPQGLNVGVIESYKVTESNFYDIKVKLSIDFRNLTHVYVIGNIYREEQKELENSLGYD